MGFQTPKRSNGATQVQNIYSFQFVSIIRPRTIKKRCNIDFLLAGILTVLFTLVLLLLILSKVMIAKKTPVQQQNGPPDVAYYHQGSARSGTVAVCHIPYNLYSPRDNLSDDVGNSPEEDSDAANPLLGAPRRSLEDRPPAYVDVLRLTEPPPPYTSREVLND